MANNHCNCTCRHYIRFIRRAFTENELNMEDRNQISFQTAMEEIDGILDEYQNGSYPTFAHCLRTLLASPVRVLEALETCRCCQRHQQNRNTVNWRISFNASDTFMDETEFLFGNTTPPETDYDSLSESTDIGSD